MTENQTYKVVPRLVQLSWFGTGLVQQVNVESDWIHGKLFVDLFVDIYIMMYRTPVSFR